MIEFDGFSEIARFLDDIDLSAAEFSILDRLGAAIADRARSKFGVYQPASGPYPAWKQLAPSTIAHKSADIPLIESGDYQGSIKWSNKMPERAVEIGTDEPYALFKEIGSSHEPPRPVLGPAALEVMNESGEEIAGEGMMAGLFDAVRQARRR